MENNEESHHKSNNNKNKYNTILMYKSTLSWITNKTEKWVKLKRNIKQGTYRGTERGDQLLGSAVSMIPNAGYDGFAAALPVAVAGVLENAGVSVSSAIAGCLPSKDKVDDLVTERAVDSILLLREAIRKNPFVYLFCDKDNKAGNKHLAKYIAWYDEDDKQIRKYLLDVNCTDKDLTNNALAMKYALERVWPPELSIILYGQCTHSGGDGALFALARELKKLGLCAQDYFITSCTLQDFQTALRNGVEQVLGLCRTSGDGQYLHTSMQMLHGAYNTQNWHKTDEIKTSTSL